MVARNFSVQDLTYSRLLQPDDDCDFMTLQELKPLSVQNLQTHHSYQPSYYELPAMVEHPYSNNYHSNNTNLDSSNSSVLELQQADNNSASSSRKRKSPCAEASDLDDDAIDDTKSVKTNDENKKQNHSEIEKRRRDKMNTYITELSSIVPMCHAMSRKLDKLTVLRMAVQHLKTIRGAVNSYTEGHYKPPFLTDHELKHLILQAADGFLFVVGCDRGRILYVSESVVKVLNYSQGDLLGQSLFDILHPKDVAKVKEQLTSPDLNPRERLIDAKTMLPVKTDVAHQGTSRFSPGARRSFFCRMKCKISEQIKEEADTTTRTHKRKNKQNSDKKYNVIQCTGYLKSWPPAKMGLEEQESEGDPCNLSCLAAIGRILPHISTVAAHSSANVRPIQFVSRHALDGKFLFIDQRATLVLGFLPQELLGTSMYEYYHHDDIPSVSEYHKRALHNTERVTTNVYRFRTKDDGFIRLQSEWRAFKNPWTKEVEYLIAKNNLILTDFHTVESTGGRSDGIEGNIDFFSQKNGNEMQRIINNHVEASKIGRQIADQINSQKRGCESSSGSSPESDQESSLPIPSAECHISTSIPTDGLRSTSTTPNVHTYTNSQSQFTLLSNTTPLPSIPDSGVKSGTSPEDRIIGLMDDAVRESPNNGPVTDGNDEAAMAVIMSLLEADAGLGGPVDFSGLPWPLP